MQTLKELIERYSGQHAEFLYYVPIIEKAERNEVDHPDIAIECCNSLFQGVSRTIVHRLNPSCDKKNFGKQDVDQQVKAALICLKEVDNVIEDDFTRRCVSLVLAIATLRNARGDISHGRAVPKELLSDRSLARLVLNMSEALLRYMLASFFALQPAKDDQIAYEANPEFNDFLDDANPLEGKPLYSLALFQQYHEDYLIQLHDYWDQQDEPDQ
jgi:hypothetical protein